MLHELGLAMRSASEPTIAWYIHLQIAVWQ